MDQILHFVSGGTVAPEVHGLALWDRTGFGMDGVICILRATANKGSHHHMFKALSARTPWCSCTYFQYSSTAD